MATCQLNEIDKPKGTIFLQDGFAEDLIQGYFTEFYDGMLDIFNKTPPTASKGP